MDRLERIRAAVAASRKASEGATRGPWSYEDGLLAKRSAEPPGHPRFSIIPLARLHHSRDPEGEYIAHHNPAAMSALLAEVEALADAHERALRVVEAAHEYEWSADETDERVAAVRAALDAFDGGEGKP